MSEQINKPNEGAPAAPDMTKYVPKEQLDKVNTDKSSLARELEETKMLLLSPEYIEFKESKIRRGKDTKPAPAAGESSNAQIEALQEELATTRRTVSNISAYIELWDVEKRFPDFDKYRDQVKQILETSKNELTYEQAYLMAKGDKKSDTPADKSDKAAKGSEKPGGFTPPPADTLKTYKTSTEATNAAVAEVAAKYGITGDTI